MKTQDGGPAFPSEQGHIPDGTWNQTYAQGMSLRDWFAGQALNGYLAGVDKDADIEGFDKARVAACCYSYADAMLEARTK